jgi:hypothetical protein
MSTEEWQAGLASFREEPISAADRWALSVIALTEAPFDPRTLEKWSKLANQAVGTIRMHCYAAHIAPRASLNFARLLRAVRLSGPGRWEPERWLDVSDERTLRRLVRTAGCDRSCQRPELEEFIVRQRFVPQDSASLLAVRQRLRSSGELR